MNAYEVLNIAPNATREEIRAAYRAMARRWHPDRFPAGPERDWANDRMAAINAAYRSCLDDLQYARKTVEDEAGCLEEARKLIDDGMYVTARKKLMGMNTRCAEWNYLFGLMLFRVNDIDKALIYLTVAAHQKPASVKYARALQEVESMNTASRRLMRLLKRNML